MVVDDIKVEKRKKTSQLALNHGYLLNVFYFNIYLIKLIGK